MSRTPSTAQLPAAVARGLASGLVSIAAMFTVPMLAALLAHSLVGVPPWLLYAPIVCWMVFTVLFLTVAACLLHVSSSARELS